MSRDYFTSIKFKSRNSFNSRLIKLKLMKSLTSVIIFGSIAAFILSLATFIWFSKDLPLPDKVQRKEGFSTVILDRRGQSIYDIYSDKNRIPVTFADIPETLKKATIAVEDKDFYKHQGFDPKGILRATFYIATFRGIQGGSTLTQQLVKNVLLTSERTIPRKIKEFLLAVQIERKYTKDEILQMYLNEAPYGGTMWGIESAAEGYFGKHTKDLTPIESVVLSGLPQRPSYYSPFSSGKNYILRSEEVLRRMREDGYITADKEYQMKKDLSQIKFASSSAQFLASHFILSIKKQLTDMFGESVVDKGGLKVSTTLDKDLQEKSEEIVKSEIDKLKGLKVTNGAVLVLDPKTGEVLTYIGGKDYDAQDEKLGNKFDVVSMGYRQPGSALKPMTYAVAFSKGYTPSSLLMDVETHFPAGSGKPDYIPKNYDGKFRGPVQIRFALGNSINIPAVKTTALIGIKDILKASYDMGLTSLAPTDDNINRLGLSLTLGGGEVRLMDLTQGYGVFATGGILNDIYSITKVVDSNGKTLYEHNQTQGKRVLSPDVSFLISSILLDNNARKETFGENSYLVIPGKTVAVKTGTTDDKKDNWTIGYTPSIAVGVWVGNNDNSAMDPKLASGVTGAAPIWNRIIKEALKDKKDEQFTKPDNVISMEIDAYGGGTPKDGKPTRSEYFIKGTEPTALSSIYQKIKVSKSDNSKLANAVEIATGAYDEKDYIVFKENDPTAGGGKNMWQDGIDQWISTQSDPLYHPPAETSDTNDKTVVVNIKRPADSSRTDNNSVEISVESKALRDIKKMEIYVDGSLKKTVNNNTFDENMDLDTGIRKIRVKAYDEKGNTGEKEITIGVKVNPNQPSATPIPPTEIPSFTPVPPTPTPV